MSTAGKKATRPAAKKRPAPAEPTASVSRDTSVTSPNKPLFALSIEEAAAGLAAKRFSSLELTTACLDHIKAVDPQLNCFIRLDEEVAIAQAKASDDRRSLERGRGILDGIPYNLKDVYATKDSPTTASSRILEGWWPPYNATAYHRLTEAGAVLLGKTNTDEFTMGSSTETSYFGVTRNPWDPERVSGGSSGGPAASIAARFGLFSIGTDTGGSIRQPAGFCGVVGLRPTYGRVSRFGELAMASSLDQTGPFANAVRDAAIVLRTLAGRDPLDATSADLPVPDYLAEIDSALAKAKPLKRLRIGIANEYFGEGIDPELEAQVRRSIDVLVQLGATPVELSLPSVRYALAVYYIICPAEVSSNMARYDGVRYGYSVDRGEDRKQLRSLTEVYAHSRAEGLGAEVKRRVMLGTHVLSSGYHDAYYTRAEQVRAVVANEFAAAFEKVDFLAAPVSPSTAFKVGEKLGDPLAMYKEDILTVPLNIAGIPGMSVPGGFVRGLPVGLQLMAARYHESLLLTVGAAFQTATDYHTQLPALLAAKSPSQT